MKSPPKLAYRFLHWFCDPDIVEDVEGDLYELYAERTEHSTWKGRLHYWKDVILLFRPGIVKNFKPFQTKINYDMFSNYLKIAKRNAFLYKGYSVINLLGLVVGITSSILISLWINDEIKVDQFHSNGDNIYQLFRNMKQSDESVITTENIPKPAADLMVEEFPEVEQVALLSDIVEFKIGNKQTSSRQSGRFASPEFMQMFSFDLLEGDKENVFDNPMNILLSETLAKNYFGDTWDESVIGQTILVEDQYEVIISGVYEDPGKYSSLQFDFLLTSAAYIALNDWVNDWGNGSFMVYASIPQKSDVSAVAERIFNQIKEHTKGASNAGDETLILHKFKDYYLYSNFTNGVVDGGRIDYVRVMTAVMVLILLIACINFMNLTTARADRRSKEIGVRKALGARKGSISIQFYTEALLFSTIAVTASVLIAYLLLPYFNLLVDKELLLDFYALETWYAIVGLALGIGVLSGTYPAIILPALNLNRSLRHQNAPGNSFIRKGLVVVQFTISTILIIATGVISAQMSYVSNKNLGLNKDNLLDIRLSADSLHQLNAYKIELAKLSQVESVTASMGNPASYGRSTSSSSWEGKDPTKEFEVNVLLADGNFIETMEMEIIEGRAFDGRPADSTSFVVNEVMADIIGANNLIGTKLSFWGIEGQVVGVVKNFHMRNFHQPIAPVILSCYQTRFLSHVIVRLNGDVGNAISEIESVTKSMFPSKEFDYQFTDEILQANYQNEETAATLVRLFAIVSIFISCIGLFGLSTFSVEQRSKEIAVRKVLGSQSSQLFVLLLKDYALLIVIAFVLAVPLGYYVAQNWLNDFEFRVDISPVLFIAAGAISLIIAMVTTGFKAYQATITNPVKALKSE
jgi:putative ABC transport system permease protein